MRHLFLRTQVLCVLISNVFVFFASLWYDDDDEVVLLLSITVLCDLIIFSNKSGRFVCVHVCARAPVLYVEDWEGENVPENEDNYHNLYNCFVSNRLRLIRFIYLFHTIFCKLFFLRVSDVQDLQAPVDISLFAGMERRRRPNFLLSQRLPGRPHRLVQLQQV